MFSAELYVPIYCYGMLAVTLLTLAVYLRSSTDQGFVTGFNTSMLPATALAMMVFIGLRPLAWQFVDMGLYVTMYSRAAVSAEMLTGDWGFDAILIFFSKYFTIGYFFLFCAGLYVLPLALAARIRHAAWGWPVFAALIGSFSFFNYGVNGMRQGIATSLVIASLATYDRKLVAALFALAAYSIHKSVALTAAAFLLARLISMPGLWAMAWSAAAVSVAFVGERINSLIFDLLPVLDDARAESYLLKQGADKGGYRWDFLLYSSVPIVISYLMAPPAIRREKEYKALLSCYIIANTFWVLVIYAAFSNRFAYLSWCILPWVVIYPFVGSRQPESQVEGSRAQTSTLGIALLAHFAFTFVMYMNN